MDKRLNLNITKTCFLNCLGCYCFKCEKEDLKYQTILKFLKQAKKSGIEKITLGGGDPLSRKNIFNFIKKLLKLGFEINLDTVGTPLLYSCKTFDGEEVEFLKNIKVLKKILVGIPLDGADNETIKKFRVGRENLFDEQIKILKLLEENSVDVCINTVLHKLNYQKLGEIYNVLKQFKNIKKWQIFQYMPVGLKGFKNKDKFNLQDDKFFGAVEEFLSSYDDKIKIDFKAGKERELSYMFVGSDGEAYKISLDNKKIVFGNVLDKTTWNNIFDNV